MTDATPPPWADGPYSIKRHGCTITHCDAEPVQTPGCIQSHGALLALRPADLTILQASENSKLWLGKPPEHLLGQSAAAAVGAAGAKRLRKMLDDEPVERNPLFAFSLPGQGDVGPLDVTLHTMGGVAIAEFEMAGLKRGETPDYYAILKKTLGRLQAAATLRGFCQIAADEVRALTGLDRVMAYRFHADGHGEVFAESRRADLPPWLGLHYPAEDIPQPVRDIFGKIWIRPLPDAQAPLFELVPLANPDTGRPLDMTYCALRGASVMYTEYLRNMGVRASLTMPIRRDSTLWGMIACHHHTPAHLPYQTRAACEFLAQMASLLIGAAEEREHFAYRLRMQGVHTQLTAAAAEAGDVTALTAGKPSLLDGIEAGGAALRHGGRWWRVGRTPGENQLEGLADWLAGRPELQSLAHPVYATDSLARDYPQGEDLADSASGVLAVTLSHTPQNLLLWFRPETVQTFDWAGNPYEKPTAVGPNGPRLTPRASFDLFSESTRLRALPWKTVEIAAAVELRMQIMQLVVNRAEHLAALNAELLRSNQELDTFAYVASHDLKEPLRGISKYAHQLLDTCLASDEDNRRRLDRLLLLTQRMDSLLDSLLYFSRVGRTQLDCHAVDLNEVVDEALDMVAARREEANADIVIPRPLPTVACDRLRVREIFSNLFSNALKYNDSPRRRIEIGYWGPEEDLRPEAPEGCARQAIFYVRDNGIGIQPRHHTQVFKIFKRLHGREEYGGGNGAGLSIVQTLVERHHGRIWLESAPGAGTTFYFTLSGGEL
ncbi:MAG: ATP-binding protein [Candidatus Methylumidiphilus sp.]